jgi:hypothetical protein
LQAKNLFEKLHLKKKKRGWASTKFKVI